MLFPADAPDGLLDVAAVAPLVEDGFEPTVVDGEPLVVEEMTTVELLVYVPFAKGVGTTEPDGRKVVGRTEVKVARVGTERAVVV